MTFDQAERYQVDRLHRRAAGPAQPAPGAPFTGGITAGDYPPPQAPVRVGGSIRQPAKLLDVRPVMPEPAVQAGISGVVILDVTIDTDGSVKDTRVLRSIPLLDQAAVDAVRQWRYEPTQLNGRPVPVIMTVTVPFLR